MANLRKEIEDLKSHPEKAAELQAKIAELRPLEHEQMREQVFSHVIHSDDIASDPSDHAAIDRIQKEHKEKGSNTVSAADLLRIEHAEHGVLSRMYLFTRQKQNDGEEIDVPVSEHDVKAGMDMSVDFGDNGNADNRVGAGHMLPPSVNAIKVTDDKGSVRIGQRMIVGDRVGYYDAMGYIDIHTSYTIHIPTDAELQTPEYQERHINIRSSMITDEREIETKRANERVTNASFANHIETIDKLSVASDAMSLLLSRVTGSTFAEKLQQAIELAKQYTADPKQLDPNTLCTPADFAAVQSVITTMLERVRNIPGFNFDPSAYKHAIAMIESSGNYYERNDHQGHAKGLGPDEYAYGKYQFTREEMKKYAKVDIYHPYGSTEYELNLSTFLKDANLQERAMDAKIASDMNDVFSGRNKYYGSALQGLTTGQHGISYYLATIHIGGPGALLRATHDWMGTSTTGYAERVERATGGKPLATIS